MWLPERGAPKNGEQGLRSFEAAATNYSAGGEMKTGRTADENLNAGKNCILPYFK